ncbi:MAG: GAF domain-containing protein [Luteibaculaceae bacterium]
MANEFIFPTGTEKTVKYEQTLAQIKGIITGEPNLIANLANTAAMLKYGLNFFWVGFYLVQDNELVLGPFQGTSACTRIAKGRGVCGSAWEKNEVLLVPNVEEFPGHIACSSASKSEIVLPLYNNQNQVVGVLDVDSNVLNDFDHVDKDFLEQVVTLLKPYF